MLHHSHFTLLSVKGFEQIMWAFWKVYSGSMSKWGSPGELGGEGLSSEGIIKGQLEKTNGQEKVIKL